MGLDTTHGCWHGPYSYFHKYRVFLGGLVGINLEHMAGFVEDGLPWSSFAPDPLHILLNHSDCDGEIAWEDCCPLANRLEELLPQFKTDDWKAETESFIRGLRNAFNKKENVMFQ